VTINKKGGGKNMEMLIGTAVATAVIYAWRRLPL